MAVVKVCRGGRTLGQAIRYAAKENITQGKDCPDDPEKALEQMKITKQIWEQTDGRQYKHYVIAFLPGEATIEQAETISDKWVKENFPTNETFSGVHTDKDHLHVHIVVNSVDFLDGHKIQLDKDDLERFKEVSDKLCLEEGLSVIDRSISPKEKEIRTYDMNKYQAMAQGKSWEIVIADKVDAALQQCEGKGYRAFKENLNAQGINCEFRGSKHITFSDKKGNKVRGATLAKSFSENQFTRESIELTLARQLLKPETIQAPLEEPPKTSLLENIPNIPMKSVADIQHSASKLGFEAKQMGNSIQSILSSDPQQTNKAPSVSSEKTTKKNRQAGANGGRSLGGDSRSREPDRPLGGGGLSVSRELDDEDRVRDLMDKGLSEELARKIVDGAEE